MLLQNVAYIYNKGRNDTIEWCMVCLKLKALDNVVVVSESESTLLDTCISLNER